MTQDIRQPEPDAISDRLDQLADRERAMPDSAFESRVFESVRARVLEPLGRPVAIRPAWWRSSWAMAAAASIAIVLTAGMFMWAGAPTQTSDPGPSIAAGDDVSTEFEEFIETVAWLEDSLPDYSWTTNSTDGPSLDSIDDLFDDVEQTLSDEEESI